MGGNSIVLNLRQRKLLNFLVNSKTTITIKQLSKKFDISQRTIRYDLENIKEYLKKYSNVELVKKPKVGVWLKCESPNVRQIVAKDINLLDGQLHILDPRERHQLMITELLTKEKPVIVKELGRLAGVSETTALKDLDSVEQWLNKRNLSLIRKRNYGIEIEGDEKEIRRGICDVLKENADFKQLFGFLQQVKDTKMLANSNRYFRDLIGDVQLIEIENVVKKAEELMGFSFADGAFTGLIIHIAISVKRIKEGNDIQISKIKLDEIQKKDEFKLGVKLARMIEKKFDVMVPIEEIGYLTLHLMGAKIRQEATVEERKVIHNTEIDNMALEIAMVAESILNIPLTKDKQFMKGLILHLKPTLSRIEFGLTVSNPLLWDIKNKYYKYFEVTQLAVKPLEKKLKRIVTEDEIGFIALHIGAAAERYKPIKRVNPRVVLVCSSGIGTTNILAVRLKQEFPSVNILGISSALDAENYAMNKKADIVITTIPINVKSVPVYLVNPLLNEEDIKKLKGKLSVNDYYIDISNERIRNIQETVKSIFEIIQNYALIIDGYTLRNQLSDFMSSLNIEKKLGLGDKKNFIGLRELLNENTIKTGLKANDWEDAVRHSGNILLENNAVEGRYIEQMINIIKEHGPYIVISKGIALLHAKPSDGVKKLMISLGVFKEGVRFGNKKLDPVHLVFAFASVDNESHLKAMRELMKLIIDRDTVEQIKSSNSVNRVIEIIDKKLRGE